MRVKHLQMSNMASPRTKTILVVEDDLKTATLLAIYLRQAGFHIVTAHDGAQAMALFGRHDPAFVVLDLMLPNVDGWDICRELRHCSDVPILILTARQEESDRVLGLTLGADDYVVKPFSPRELVARVKAILRRIPPRRAKPGARLTYDGLELDAERHRVMLNGQRVSLTPSEFSLLETLMGAPGRVFSRQDLLARLYPRGESVVDRVVDVHIGKLRHKIEDQPTSPCYVLTVRGIGYQFVCED